MHFPPFLSQSNMGMSVMTPSSSAYQRGPSHMTTPGSSGMPPMANTPSYQRTPRGNAQGGAVWPGATPRTPAVRTPVMNQPSGLGQSYTVSKQQSTGFAPSGEKDWAKAAEMWANRKKQQKSPRASPHPSPAHRGMESPFSGSFKGTASPAGGGDGTPLIDER